VPGLEADRLAVEGELSQLLSGQTRVWLVLSAPPTNMHGFTWADLDQAPDLMSTDALKIELDRRLPKLAEYSFTGVLLILYDAN
jgi:hypothetical protein